MISSFVRNRISMDSKSQEGPSWINLFFFFFFALLNVDVFLFLQWSIQLSFFPIFLSFYSIKTASYELRTLNFQYREVLMKTIH